VILLIVLLALLTLVMATCGSAETAGERDRAVEAARAAYELAVAAGVDLSAGPCIGDPVIPGWVADVAHDPRLPADDDPANQCPGYRSGVSAHFVELTPDGRLIQAR
jgi:hypothetical protein